MSAQLDLPPAACARHDETQLRFTQRPVNRAFNPREARTRRQLGGLGRSGRSECREGLNHILGPFARVARGQLWQQHAEAFAIQLCDFVSWQRHRLQKLGKAP